MATWSRENSIRAGYIPRRYDNRSYGEETRGDTTFALSTVASTWATRNSKGTYWGSGDSFTLGFGEASVLDVTDDVIELVHQVAGSCSSMNTSCTEGFDSTCTDMDPCTCEDDIYSEDEDDSMTATDTITENMKARTLHLLRSRYAPRRGSSEPGRKFSTLQRGTLEPRRGSSEPGRKPSTLNGGIPESKRTSSLPKRISSTPRSRYHSSSRRDRYAPNTDISEFQRKQIASRDTFTEMSRNDVSGIFRPSPTDPYEQLGHNESYPHNYQPHYAEIEEREASYSNRSAHQKSEQRDAPDIRKNGTGVHRNSPESNRRNMSPAKKQHLAQKNARTIRTKAYTEHRTKLVQDPSIVSSMKQMKKPHFRIMNFRKRSEA